MKLMNVLFILLLTTLSFSAFASHEDCPLKNLKKNQTRAADGTAYFPNQSLNQHSKKRPADVSIGG